MATPAASTLSREQFEDLLRPILDMAYRYAHRLAGNSDEAMDLVQEAAVLAFKGRHTYTPETNFKAWYFRILTNQFYRHRRKRNLESVSLEEAPDVFLYHQAKRAGLDVAGGDPAAELFKSAEMIQVVEAMDKLPDEYREAALLYFASQMSYEEIAETLDIPVGTVRSRLHRARKHLQTSLWDLATERGWVEVAR
jgi:RNA polymerase sigma-70 factor (ECF subfamily)